MLTSGVAYGCERSLEFDKENLIGTCHLDKCWWEGVMIGSGVERNDHACVENERKEVDLLLRRCPFEARCQVCYLKLFGACQLS